MNNIQKQTIEEEIKSLESLKVGLSDRLLSILEEQSKLSQEYLDNQTQIGSIENQISQLSENLI